MLLVLENMKINFKAKQSGIKIKLGIESTDEQLFDLVVEATGK